MEPRVTKQDLKGGAGGGVLGKDCPDVFPDMIKHHVFSSGLSEES
jgi:hypothetical protein